jgi:polysaccharide biosynthesis/export protein
MIGIVKFCFGFAVMLYVVGCSTLPPLPPPAVTEPPPEQSASPPSLTNEVYKLGPDDQLQITIYEHPDLSRSVSIDPNGSFDFPLIGDVKAAGLTVQALEKELKSELGRDYLVDPQVTVTVTQYRNRQVYVLGAVKAPGVYPLRYNQTLLEAISAAGGLMPDAGSYAVLVRSAQEGNASGSNQQAPRESIRIDLEKLLAGESRQSIPIYNGDTIRVLPGDFVFISGQVNNPGRYPLDRNSTVETIVILAGGFTEFAAKHRIQVRRLIDGEPQEFRARLHDRLQNNDVIVVPESVL